MKARRGFIIPVQGTKGGRWKGLKAIVVRVDDSATIESVATSDYRVYSPANPYEHRANPTGADIFTTSAAWMPFGDGFESGVNGRKFEQEGTEEDNEFPLPAGKGDKFFNGKATGRLDWTGCAMCLFGNFPVIGH